MARAVEPGARSTRRWAALIAAAVVLVAIAVVLNAKSPRSKTGPAKVGSPAPEISGSTLEGDRVALSQFRGRGVLVNFWASWCLPCRSEFPKIAHQRALNPGLAVIGVVFEDSASSARAFAERLNATWPSLFDKDDSIAAAYGVRRPLPRSFFIDSRGIVRRSVYGEMTQAELDRYAAEVTPKKT